LFDEFRFAFHTAIHVLGQDCLDIKDSLSYTSPRKKCVLIQSKTPRAIEKEDNPLLLDVRPLHNVHLVIASEAKQSRGD